MKKTYEIDETNRTKLLLPIPLQRPITPLNQFPTTFPKYQTRTIILPHLSDTIHDANRHRISLPGWLDNRTQRSTQDNDHKRRNYGDEKPTRLTRPATTIPKMTNQTGDTPVEDSREGEIQGGTSLTETLVAGSQAEIPVVDSQAEIQVMDSRKATISIEDFRETNIPTIDSRAEETLEGEDITEAHQEEAHQEEDHQEEDHQAVEPQEADDQEAAHQEEDHQGDDHSFQEEEEEEDRQTTTQTPPTTTMRTNPFLMPPSTRFANHNAAKSQNTQHQKNSRDSRWVIQEPSSCALFSPHVTRYST